ncbi:MAG: LPS assembly lipoprotein LptE [Deltaproteobacteria bacterium]|nr:LPS assembly lipoprotein LptE [Deltaproteobacteria bacterium]
MTAFGFSLLFACLLAPSGCGYSLNSSPYRLNLKGETLRLSIPVAENQSRFGRLGPELTQKVIERLSGTEGLVIDATNPEATLKLTITSVRIGSGSWDVEINPSNRDTPSASSSRTAAVAVQAVLTTPESGGSVTKTRSFYSYRTYMVTLIQGQVETQEAEALDWVINDISEKIGATMFTEF